ncbi:MAG: hypothetical protein ACRD5G_09230 [Candidatus Acidiferrales bacterium]
MDDAAPCVRITVQSDPRLLTGVATAVELCAKSSGLSERASNQVKTAAAEAARETFSLLADRDSSLDIAVQAFADRVEVILEHRGEALPTAGLDTFLTTGVQGPSAGTVTGLSLLSRVDRVLYTTEKGVSRTTLVKYRKKAES